MVELSDMSDVQPIIAAWKSAIEKLAYAVEVRNLDFFDVAQRDVDDSYEAVHAILDSDMRRESLTELERNAIIAVIRDWQRLSEKIRNWENELKEEIKKVHREVSAGRKISKAYSHRTLTGNKLRLSR